MICSRRKTGIFTMSNITSNARAAANVPATAANGSGAIANPPVTSAEAMRISAADDGRTQLPGRDLQRWRRFRME